MTEPIVAPPPKPSSFWEDVIDIFFQPARVFRRRENTSVWPPMLFVAIAIAVIFAFSFNAISPAFEAEFTRNTAKAMAKNPQMTAEMMDKARGFGEATAKYGTGPLMLISMFIVGCFTWLISKIVGAKESFHTALVVAAWSYMPRVLGALAGAIQGLIMDPAKMNSMLSITLSPARFMNPDTANPLLFQLAGRFDIFTLWVTVLLGVGIYVTGRVSKDRAVLFAIMMWIVGSLPALRQGFTAM
jgi:hypothetical protein